jgi:hypothetical protein
MKCKAKKNDRVLLNSKALRRYRDRVGNKTGKVIDVQYEWAMKRSGYNVKFPDDGTYYLWSYEFNKL